MMINFKQKLLEGHLKINQGASFLLIWRQGFLEKLDLIITLWYLLDNKEVSFFDKITETMIDKIIWPAFSTEISKKGLN